MLLGVEGVLAPLESVRAWQWAWRPQGPLLGERHVQTVVRRSTRAWDHRRWLGVTGKAPPADGAALVEHLGETLRAIAQRSLPPEEGDAVVRRMLHPTGEVERYPEVAPELERLRADGVRLGAVSALPAESARWLLRRVGLDGELLVAAGDGPGPVLPAREALTAAVDRLGAGRDATAVVGSLYWSDVRAAHRAGVRGLLVDRFGAWPSVRVGRLLSGAGLRTALGTLGAATPDEAAPAT